MRRGRACARAAQGFVAAASTSTSVPVRRCAKESAARIAIFYPTDPLGHVPSGIDSVIRGILKWAPADLSYTLYGATSDPKERPVGRECRIGTASGTARFVPLVAVDPGGSRRTLPLTVRYLHALRRARARRSMRCYDLLDFHRIEPATLFFRDRRPKNVIIHQDMAVLRNENSDIMWRHAPWLYELIERRVFRRIDRVFCVRRSAVDRYVARDPGLAGRVEFLPTFVDSTVFTPADPAGRSLQEVRCSVKRDLGLAVDTALLVSVGRLDHQKDPLLLLQALRLLLEHEPDTHLVMVGDGVLRSRVEAFVVEAGLQGKVTLSGTRPAAEIARLLRAGSAFALSSAYEGMPIALLEALAVGVPVATTDVGEVRLVVREGLNGHIARTRTPEAFCEALTTVLRSHERLRGRPCVQAVADYRAESVLGRIYENHRRQAFGVLV